MIRHHHHHRLRIDHLHHLAERGVGANQVVVDHGAPFGHERVLAQQVIGEIGNLEDGDEQVPLALAVNLTRERHHARQIEIEKTANVIRIADVDFGRMAQADRREPIAKIGRPRRRTRLVVDGDARHDHPVDGKRRRRHRNPERGNRSSMPRREREHRVARVRGPVHALAVAARKPPRVDLRDIEHAVLRDVESGEQRHPRAGGDRPRRIEVRAESMRREPPPVWHPAARDQRIHVVRTAAVKPDDYDAAVRHEDEGSARRRREAS
jgi:hypothetical protein